MKREVSILRASVLRRQSRSRNLLQSRLAAHRDFIVAQSRTFLTAVKSGEVWSAEDDQTVLRLGGIFTVVEIAKKVGRTWAAVKWRRQYLASL